jgi:small subunit ribosomal protein S18
MIENTVNKRVSPIRLSEKITYKKVNLLTKFITEYGKILPRYATNLTVKQQKDLKKSIKQIRNINLFAYTVKNKILYRKHP